MDIRQATSQDIPDIVTLLKLSLGESLMPKSEGYWMWKHVNNPFGVSPVLMTVDAGKIVGVRAFMRWHWSVNGSIIPAVRAVDTATHPDFQGKGIFKKLTLSLLEQCKDGGDQFVFNTPNANSKPGYLKMGWEEAGRLPISVSLQQPLSLLSNVIAKRSHDVPDISANSKIQYWLDHPGLDDLIGKSRRSDCIQTAYNRQYLKWRYIDVPVVQYTAFGSERNGRMTSLLIGRIKSSRAGLEFRITDLMVADGEDKTVIADLRQFMKAHNIAYCTSSGFLSDAAKTALKGLIFLPPVSQGPIVTVRKINFGEMQRLKNFAGWSPSLGDLELF